MKYCFAFLLSIALLLGACKSTSYTPTDFPDDQITFGSGGGIAGSYTFYTLLENGQLFKKAGEGKYNELTKVKRKMAKQIFASYQSHELGTVTYDEPDNMSYFLEYKDESGVHRIVWGGAAQGLKEEAKDLYKSLQELVQPKPSKK